MSEIFLTQPNFGNGHLKNNNNFIERDQKRFCSAKWCFFLPFSLLLKWENKRSLYFESALKSLGENQVVGCLLFVF